MVTGRLVTRNGVGLERGSVLFGRQWPTRVLTSAVVVAMWPAPARAELPSAKVAHEQAVSAVQGQDLERAKRGFLMAYIEAPRPILLYNLGLACRDLGQLEEARRYFRRFLAEPSLPSDDPTRGAAQEELTKLDTLLPAEVSGEPDAMSGSSATAGEASCPVSEPPVQPVEHQPPVDIGAARWRGAALGVGAFGAATAAGGLAMFLLSRGSSPEQPNTFQDGAWQQRSQDLQIGGVVMMIAGGALAVGGVATWFAIGDETKVEVGVGRVGLTTKF